MTFLINFRFTKLSYTISPIHKAQFQRCYFLRIDIIRYMLYLGLSLLLIVLGVGYKYYYKPKTEKQRYVKLFRSLGYTVYEQPFSFIGLSFAQEFERGVKLHKDAMYLERTVYPEVDVAIGNILDKVLIIFVNPDLIKEFHSGSTPYKYPKWEAILAGTKAVFGEGLVFSQDEVWKNKKKLLSKVFNFDLIKENIPKIVQICNRCYDDFDSTHKVGENKYKYNTLSLSARIFNGVIMKCFFGYDHIKDKIGGLTYEQFVVETISKAAELTLTPLLVFFGKFAWNTGLTAPIRHVKEGIRLMRAKAAEILKQRTEEVLNSPRKQNCTDIIEALIYEKLANKEQFSYSEAELIDQFQTFLIAGTDTTTRFFTMIIYYLGKYPKIHKKVREQINAIIKTDADITYDNLKKLVYIDWIQLETTRMYGPANGLLYRNALEDNYIKDVPIIKGTIVSTQPRGNHYNPKYFKDPNQFRPERWESECEGIHPYAFIGFSSGMRSCIGKHLAYLQSKIALIKLIKRYETIQVPEQLVIKLTFLYEPEPFEVVLTKAGAQQ